MESMMAGFGESSTAMHRWTAEKKPIISMGLLTTSYFVGLLK
jgi:hypothetical protein